MSGRPSNLERYKKDLDDFVHRGERLHLAIQAECYPEKFAGSCGERNMATKRALSGRSCRLLRRATDHGLPKREPLSASCYPIGLRTTSATMKSQSQKRYYVQSYRIEDDLQGLNVTRTFGLQKETFVWARCRHSTPPAAIEHPEVGQSPI